MFVPFDVGGRRGEEEEEEEEESSHDVACERSLACPSPRMTAGTGTSHTTGAASYEHLPRNRRVVWESTVTTSA